jgi:hypothetical protein
MFPRAPQDQAARAGVFAQLGQLGRQSEDELAPERVHGRLVHGENANAFPLGRYADDRGAHSSPWGFRAPFKPTPGGS